MMAPIPNDWISEEEVARQLGVERDRIRAQRPHLGPGEVTLHGRVICWLRAAAARVATSMGLPKPFPEKNAPAVTPPASRTVKGLLLEKNPPPDAPETLTVFSSPGAGGWHFGNHHLIRAKRLCGEVVIVRVVDSRKFLPRLRNGQPMTFQACRAESGLWWRLTGREPRYPGQW